MTMQNPPTKGIFTNSSRYFFTLLFLLLPISIFADEVPWLIKSVKVNYVLDRDFNQPKESEVVFKNGHKAKGGFIDFKVIDFFDTSEKVTFILFSAKECVECDANPSIYINAVSDKIYGFNRFDYPGKFKSYKDNQLVSVSRMFYGQCLAEPKKVLLIYSAYLDTENVWQKNFQLWQFVGNKIKPKETDITEQMIKKTEASLQAGKCFEVFGIDGHSEP